MSVVFKFVCVEKAELSRRLLGSYDGDSSPIRVELSPVHGDPFGKYTPCAEITMTIYNKEAADQFKVDEEYYVTFKPVSEKHEECKCKKDI